MFFGVRPGTPRIPPAPIRDSDKKTASLPTHTGHQSVSGPYPVLPPLL